VTLARRLRTSSRVRFSAEPAISSGYESALDQRHGIIGSDHILTSWAAASNDNLSTGIVLTCRGRYREESGWVEMPAKHRLQLLDYALRNKISPYHTAARIFAHTCKRHPSEKSANTGLPQDAMKSLEFGRAKCGCGEFEIGGLRDTSLYLHKCIQF
jgi:hypothetical protein